ncbi:MAG TPA: FkbM family methyltransferase [Vicinamibacterales bacterium]|jgi:FkbM family methyltransferase
MKPTSIANPKEKIEELGRRIDRLHRSVLEPGVLRGLLPIKSRLLPYRMRAPETRLREDRFRASSESYARTLADNNAFAANARTMELDGLRWWVPILRPDDDADAQRNMRHQDFPYRVITQTREVALGGVMLDVGCNNGRMAVPRAILGDVSAVYGAEPDPLNYTCLVRNVRDNHLSGIVMPDWTAIGSENGVIRLRRAKHAGGHKVIDATATPRGEIIDVPCSTLDSWIERLGIALEEISFVKVDVQGSEMAVLRGATRLLQQKHIAWQMEIDPPLLAERQLRTDDLYEMLGCHFTHFIDLNRQLAGPRVQPTSEMASALAYILETTDGRTDVLLFSMA